MAGYCFTCMPRLVLLLPAGFCPATNKLLIASSINYELPRNVRAFSFNSIRTYTHLIFVPATLLMISVVNIIMMRYSVIVSSQESITNFER